MQLDPIEIRLGNLFEYRKQVLEISERDIQSLTILLPELKPILINGNRLSRLNFNYVGYNASRAMHWQRYANSIYFNLFQQKDETYYLQLNEEIKLRHIQYIHQLQNVYYDLTGDVLTRQKPGEQIRETKTEFIQTGDTWASKRRSGPGKYRSKPQ